MIICITGMPGSGKSEAAKAFAEHGFAIEEMGDEVRRQAKLAINASDGPAVWEFAASLKAENGMDVIAETIASRIAVDSDTVISGLRNADELGVFREKFGDQLIVLEIYAPLETRYTRILERGRGYVLKDYAQFLERERNELEGLGQTSVKDVAEHTIKNTDSIEDLKRSIHAFLALKKSK